jgi:hypothetical protein
MVCACIEDADRRITNKAENRKKMREKKCNITIILLILVEIWKDSAFFSLPDD